MASELLENDWLSPDSNPNPNKTPIFSTVVANTEGLGTIVSPYRAIINDYIQSVFNIDSPKEWQILLIKSLVFSDYASSWQVMCI